MKFLLKSKEAVELLKDFSSVEKNEGFEFDVEFESFASTGTKSELEELESYMGYINERIDQIRQAFYAEIAYMHERIHQHELGHLPKITSVEQLQKAVDALGLNAEYNVQKRTLYI